MWIKSGSNKFFPVSLDNVRIHIWGLSQKFRFIPKRQDMLLRQPMLELTECCPYSLKNALSRSTINYKCSLRLNIGKCHIVNRNKLVQKL